MQRKLILLSLLAAFTGCVSRGNLVLVENNSDTVCTTVTVAVCDSSWVIENMIPGEVHEFTVSYTHDDDFKVRVESSAGNSIEGNFGYVTHGMTGDRVRISIEDDSIAFRQHSGNSY